MALYHHVANKEALLAGVVALVFGDFTLPAQPNQPWQAQVRACVMAYHTLICAHPHLALYLIGHSDLSAQAALPVNEALYQALAQAGLPPLQIVQAADTLIDYLHGYLLGEQSGQVGQPGERHALLERLTGSPPQQFPTLQAVYSALPAQETASSLEAGLDLLLAGIAAQAKGLPLNIL
jgi:AcrR family transcriptional regulator